MDVLQNKRKGGGRIAWPVCAWAVMCLVARAAEPPATPAAPPPAPVPAMPVQAAGHAPVTAGEAGHGRRVTNIWVDTDIRQVVQDMAAQTDTVILCDPTVQGVVSMSVKDMPLEECLERVCASCAFNYTKVKDYYIVGKAEPGTPMFQYLSKSEPLKLSYATPDQVRLLLHPSLAPYVTFDKTSGAVVVTAPEAIRQRVLEAVKVIDQPSPQVAIEAVVFELTQEGSKDLGLDWQFDKRHVAVGGHGLVGTFTYDSNSDVGTFVDLTLRAIVESRKGQVLANPRVLVMHNTAAEIFVGQEKYFTLLSGQASNPYYTLQSIKAGVTLKVLPYVGKEGRITLDLEPEVSDVVADASNTGNIDPHGNNQAALPVVTRRYAKTVVSLDDGQTVLIGGLLLDQNRSIVDKVPAAGDVPGLGAAFRNVRGDKQQQEVVILITANLVDNHHRPAEDLASRLEQQFVSPMDAIAASAKGGAP